MDKLELNHNKIEELVDYSFEGLPKLTSLSIDYNKIRFVEPRAFSGLDGKCEKCEMCENYWENSDVLCRIKAGK